MVEKWWLNSQEKKEIMIGVCQNDFDRKKKALVTDHAMTTLWPLEPYPLCASHLEFKKLVGPSSLRREIQFDDSSRNLRILIVVVIMLVSHLKTQEVALNAANLKCQVFEADVLRNFAYGPLGTVLNFKMKKLLSELKRDTWVLAQLKELVAGTHPAQNFFCGLKASTFK